MVSDVQKFNTAHETRIKMSMDLLPHTNNDNRGSQKAAAEKRPKITSDDLYFDTSITQSRNHQQIYS